MPPTPTPSSPSSSSPNPPKKEPSPKESSPSNKVSAPCLNSTDQNALPYRIAVLCYLFDDAGNILLLHRAKSPNFDRYSPIGGKLELDLGESPKMCALREIEEEAGIVVSPDDLALVGIVSERSFEDAGHWLLFCYEVTRPVIVQPGPHEEGILEWHPIDQINNLNLPRTDREIIWPTYLQHRGGGFFMLHLECGKDNLTWTLDETRKPSE